MSQILRAEYGSGKGAAAEEVSLVFFDIFHIKSKFNNY
jgi:hypothetical protein